MFDTTSPQAICEHLTSNGWTQTGRYHNAEVWADAAGREVLVPDSANLRDYDRRISELLAVLAS